MDALKEVFSRSLLESFAADVQATWPAFDRTRFLKLVFDAAWSGRALKERMRHISHCLRAVLPPEYPEALQILVDVTRRFILLRGENMSFEYMFIPDFVEAYGPDYPDASLAALELITQWSSAEFAIRPFLLRYPERLHAQLRAWANHPSAMVRRLASEGFRPRLPWGMGVPTLKRDPSPILPVLEHLKNDPAETVRRSVANNLNDISKDHPQLVLDIAARWLGQSPETDWVVRHACRGLLKKGNAEALAHFGFAHGAEGLAVTSLECPQSVSIGGRLEFGFTAENQSTEPVKTRLEYGIDFITSTGKTAVKVFKIKEITLKPGQREIINKYHRFTDFTTRKHFEGTHHLSVIVNGKAMEQCSFEVKR